MTQALQKSIEHVVMPGIERAVASHVSAAASDGKVCGLHGCTALLCAVCQVSRVACVAVAQSVVGAGVGSGVGSAEVARQVTESLRAPIQDAFKAHFQSVLLPSFEASTRVMFSQINDTFTRFANHQQQLMLQYSQGHAPAPAGAGAGAATDSSHAHAQEVKELKAMMSELLRHNKEQMRERERDRSQIEELRRTVTEAMALARAGAGAAHAHDTKHTPPPPARTAPAPASGAAALPIRREVSDPFYAVIGGLNGAGATSASASASASSSSAAASSAAPLSAAQRANFNNKQLMSAAMQAGGT
jgi:hypothetical protein